MKNTVLTKTGLKDFKYEDHEYKEHTIECSWSVLRNTFTIEEGVTYGDLLDLIENDLFLHSFVAENYPLWNSYVSVNEDIDYYPIRWTGCVTNGKLQFFNDSRSVPNPSLPLKLEPFVRIEGFNGKVYHEGKYCWSLLDVLEAVFGDCQCQIEPGFIFKPEGLWHPGLDLVDEPFKYLVKKCDIEPSVTLQNMFNWVRRHDDVKDFIQFYSWCHSIDEFHEEAQKPYDPSTDDEPLASIDVTRVAKFGKFRDKDPWTFDNYLDMGGSKDGDEQGYALEFTPVNELAHLPLSYASTTEICQSARYSRSGNVKEGHKLLVKCIWPYTLLELLDAIYWEISFMGAPEDRDGAKEELQERYENFDKNELMEFDLGDDDDDDSE